MTPAKCRPLYRRPGTPCPSVFCEIPPNVRCGGDGEAAYRPHRRPSMHRHLNTDRHQPFAGLRVAVTGGTSGLGLALVRELVDRGARVAFVARDAGRVE